MLQKLQFVSKCEAVVRYCTSRSVDCMVIDIGGSTVEITVQIAQKVDAGNGAILISKACGGGRVNTNFSKMLQKLVKDHGYKRFLAFKGIKQKALLKSALYEEFEGQKAQFGQCRVEDIRVNLWPIFAQFYDKELQDINMGGVSYADGMLYINKEVVESHLFGPVLDGIIECVLIANKASYYFFKAFCLTGGFGSCKYVFEKVSAAIKKANKCSCEISVWVHVPSSPELAVSIGAARNPENKQFENNAYQKRNIKNFPVITRCMKDVANFSDVLPYTTGSSDNIRNKTKAKHSGKEAVKVSTIYLYTYIYLYG